jgi:hypothetical protein
MKIGISRPTAWRLRRDIDQYRINWEIKDRDTAFFRILAAEITREIDREIVEMLLKAASETK